jgi:hypothetical protein
MILFGSTSPVAKNNLPVAKCKSNIVIALVKFLTLKASPANANECNFSAASKNPVV